MRFEVWFPVVTLILGSGLTYLGQWFTDARQRTVAEKAARDQRRHQRLDNAYVELLTMTERIGQWASMVQPMINIGQPVTSLPELGEQARVEGLTRAYGSKEVLTLLASWRGAVREIIEADYLIRMDQAASEKGKESGIDTAKTWMSLPALRTAEEGTRKALVDQVAKELESRSDDD